MTGFFSNIFGTTSTAPSVPIPSTPVDNSPVTQVAAPVLPAPVVSPMDSWKDLWEPPTKQGVDGTLPANMFAGVDPTKMLEAARKVDFSKSIPPDVISKITAGGPEAAQAFMSALNDVTQRSYAQSSFAATKIVEQALQKFQEGLENRLPSQIRNHQVSDNIRQANPTLNHPAAAPIIEALQAQFTVKYPNATATEIADMASRYLVQFSQLANPAKPAAAGKDEQDWEIYFK